jgi:subtilisin family serine protease
VSSPDPLSANRFRKAAIDAVRRGSPLLSAGTNPAIGIGELEFRIPVAPDATLMGSLQDACRLINADQLPPNLNGDQVNIVLIDTGIDKNIITPPGSYGGGWWPQQTHPTLPRPAQPGLTAGPDALHGAMVVNNIFAVAPRARIFDVPLIPPTKIYDIFSFLHVAHATLHQILHDIKWFQAHGFFTGPWIFMNAWAVFDRRSEGIFLGDYTENKGPLSGVAHQFIHQIEQIAQARFDLVFCAGNCGEVCPDGRCGPDDYGPGRGIWGANAHQDVLTTGAVCVDRTWSGYSSEGPGPTPHLFGKKPDLCAPSQFLGTSQYPPNTGTSSSAALAAGTVAALRSYWDQTRVPPYILKLILNDAAMQPLPPGWNRWFGNGILDALAAYHVLLSNYP